MNFNGLAGNQVLEWADLDSEIKTAGLKNVSPCVNVKTIAIHTPWLCRIRSPHLISLSTEISVLIGDTLGLGNRRTRRWVGCSLFSTLSN